MREMGAMWQIGVLAGNPSLFLLQNGPFPAFSHHTKIRRVFRGVST